MTAPTPVRPSEEVAGQYVPVTLAGEVYILAELPNAANRQFIRYLRTEVLKRLGAIPDMETVEQVMDAIAEHADLWLELLSTYDRMGGDAWAQVYGREPKYVLPDHDYLDERSTPTECYEAIKKVTVAVFPTGRDLIRLIPELVPALMQAVTRGTSIAMLAAMTLSRSTSFSPPSTDGSPTKSSDASPPPSSSASSTRQASGATRSRKSK